ncbi:MAG: sigma-70 family RNA polymerase sigma factor [Nitratireductor sp.]
MDAKEMALLCQLVANERDKQAFAKLYSYFTPRLNAYLRKLNMSNGEAEDLAQEVMITLWHKAHMFDPSKSSLSTWLFRVARNRRIDLARRDKSGALDEHDPIFLPEELTPADEEIDLQTRQVQMRKAMESLTPDQFETVRLAFFLGMSHSEISKETNTPVGTVKSRIRLAFGRLRAILNENDKVDQAE